MRLSARHVAQFLVLAMAGTVAAAQDALTVEMDRAADSVALTLNAVAGDGPSLEVAVRPGYMALGELKVHCPMLGNDLRDMLMARLERIRQRGTLRFQVRAVDARGEAEVEVNTKWRHDVRGGADVMRAVVLVKVDEQIVSGSEMRLRDVAATHLTEEQKRCLMRWTHSERLMPLAERQLVTVWEYPVVGSSQLRKYRSGQEVEIHGDVEPIDTGESWQLVWVEDRSTHGFAKVAGQGAAPKTGLGEGEEFQDCEACPKMVVVPVGSYRMGEKGKQHEVTIGAPFALGKYEVTVDEFGRFVSETGYSAKSSCRTYENGKWEYRSSRGWRNPGFGQSGQHPVTCVSWDDVRAYVGWLSRKTGKQYRLPSESEWEYAARAGTEMVRYWGEGESGQCRHANGGDASLKVHYSNWRRRVASCRDGHVHTAPVGSFRANGWGLHDMLGNVWEWTEDCWNGSHAGAPSDGSAWEYGECKRRVLRGGSWYFGPSYLRAVNRIRLLTGYRFSCCGFRVAWTLTP